MSLVSTDLLQENRVSNTVFETTVFHSTAVIDYKSDLCLFVTNIPFAMGKIKIHLYTEISPRSSNISLPAVISSIVYRQKESMYQKQSILNRILQPLEGCQSKVQKPNIIFTLLH